MEDKELREIRKKRGEAVKEFFSKYLSNPANRMSKDDGKSSKMHVGENYGKEEKSGGFTSGTNLLNKGEELKSPYKKAEELSAAKNIKRLSAVAKLKKASEKGTWNDPEKQVNKPKVIIKKKEAKSVKKYESPYQGDEYFTADEKRKLFEDYGYDADSY